MVVLGWVRHQKHTIWTSEVSVHIIFFGDGPVHILPYDPQCHELFAIYHKNINNCIVVSHKNMNDCIVVNHMNMNDCLVISHKT